MGLEWVHTDRPSAEVVSSCTYPMSQVVFVDTNKYVQRGNDDERQTHGESQRTLRFKGALMRMRHRHLSTLGYKANRCKSA